jgi:HEAT repeat protein
MVLALTFCWALVIGHWLPAARADTALDEAACRELEFDALFFHAQRYGTTPVKRANKRLARAELRARGAGSLDYLMQKIHVRNIWYAILADQLVRRMDDADCAPVLVRALGSEHERTRRFAGYFLGDCEAREDWWVLLPLLSEEKAAGPAIRTLGTWRVREAVPLIVPFLQSGKERRRITAANALGAIGDERAVAPLIAALGDPYFTVRRAAGKALVAIGRPAVTPLLEAFAEGDRVKRREAVRVFGGMRTRRAIRPLRRVLRAGDRALREDAARALLAIDPRRAPRWLQSAGLDPAVLGPVAPSSDGR